MAEKRIKSLEIFERKPVPTWGPDLSGLNLDELVLYSPPTGGTLNSWDDVPEEMKKTYEDLGPPPGRAPAAGRRRRRLAPGAGV